MRLIDADKVEKSLQLSIDSFGRDHNSTAPIIAHALGYALSKVENSHTIEAVPVVRCRECKHHRDKNEQEQQYLAEDILICTSQDATEDCWNAVWPDHFCSYGEKEGADNEP